MDGGERSSQGQRYDPLRSQLARVTDALDSQLPQSFPVGGVSLEDQRNHCIPKAINIKVLPSLPPSKPGATESVSNLNMHTVPHEGCYHMPEMPLLAAAWQDWQHSPTTDVKPTTVPLSREEDG